MVDVDGYDMCVFNDAGKKDIYTVSLHDAVPIYFKGENYKGISYAVFCLCCLP